MTHLNSDLAALAGSTGFPRVTIHMPSHPTFPECLQDPIRLYNALKEAERQLVGAGWRSNDVERLLAPARERGKGHISWRYQDEGLAVFIEDGRTRWMKVPAGLPERTVVAARYDIRPLIPILRDRGGFHVLAVSAHGARFFNGTRSGLREIQIEDMPEGIAQLRQGTELGANVGFHAREWGSLPGGTAAPKFAALGDSPEDYEQTLLDHYARDVAKAVDEHLSAGTAPLVVVALPRMLGRLRHFLHYSGLVQSGLDTDPGTLSDSVLHARAWAVAESVLLSEREALRARLNAAVESETPLFSKSLEPIVKATEEGRVDTVFLGEDDVVWGAYDETYRTVRIDRVSGPQNEDLLNLVALKTLRQGGDVRVLPAALRQRVGPVAALFRY